MKTIRKYFKFAALATLAFAGAALFSTHARADAAAGATTYKTKCAACHGAEGKGNPALKTMDFASAEVQKMTDAELTTIISNGKGKMPAYAKSLKPDQIADLVLYIRSFAKK
jgi:mono/diheme cytochrome c family protein